MTLVDREVSNSIHTGTSGFQKKKSSGGCAANTIHGLSHLGAETAFIGKIGVDDMGRFFKKDMEVNKICPILYNSVTETGRAMAMISPDSERTFATFLGAAVELDSNDISLDIFKGYHYLYIEGYLVQNPGLIEKAMRLAKTSGLKLCLDLASYNVVDVHREFLIEMIKKYVDIVFANEQEAKSLTSRDPEEAIDIISDLCEIAVVKLGPNGSMIKSGKELVKIDPFPARVVDTTGAGDLYAAGFLYGISQGMSLQTAGTIGSLVASKVIEVVGAKMDESTWELLRRDINKLQTEYSK
jgi:sugar/nucleoside kinase (ribokinase family)